MTTDLVARAAQLGHERDAHLLVGGECCQLGRLGGQPVEQPANKAFYEDAVGPKEIWEVPEAGHVGGLEARPQGYERRVIGFFDDALLAAK